MKRTQPTLTPTLRHRRDVAQVWDWRDGEVHLVGQASVPFETLITPGFEAPLINPKKKNVRLLLSPTRVCLGESPHRLAD